MKHGQELRDRVRGTCSTTVREVLEELDQRLQKLEEAHVSLEGSETRHRVLHEDLSRITEGLLDAGDIVEVQGKHYVKPDAWHNRVARARKPLSPIDQWAAEGEAHALEHCPKEPLSEEEDPWRQPPTPGKHFYTQRHVDALGKDHIEDLASYEAAWRTKTEALRSRLAQAENLLRAVEHDQMHGGILMPGTWNDIGNFLKNTPHTP